MIHIHCGVELSSFSTFCPDFLAKRTAQKLVETAKSFPSSNREDVSEGAKAFSKKDNNVLDVRSNHTFVL